MHQYLKAIGFGPIKKKAELKEILEQTRETFTHQMTVSYNEEADYCEFQKEYGQDVGITLCGELDDHDQFDMEYYFPYFQGSGVTTYADVSIEKRIEREQYVGICEDAKVGISLIFTMQNGVEYMKERQLGMMTGAPNGVTFSGLALSGRILLPVRKSETQMRFAREEAKTRKQLLSAARNGDQGAIETLTLEEWISTQKFLVDWPQRMYIPLWTVTLCLMGWNVICIQLWERFWRSERGRIH